MKNCRKCGAEKREILLRRVGDSWECVGKCNIPDVVIPGEHVELIRNICSAWVQNGEMGAAEFERELLNMCPAPTLFMEMKAKLYGLRERLAAKKQIVEKIFGPIE